MVVGAMRRRRRDVLELDGAARGDHRSGQEGDDVAAARDRAEPDNSARAGDASRGARGGGCRGGRSGGAAARDRAGAGGRAASSADPQDLGDDTDRAERGDERRELTADPSNLGAELPAVRTVAQVPPCQAAGADAAVVGDDQVLADAGAGGVAGLVGLGEPHTRTHEKRLDGGDRDPEGPGDVGVGHAGELAHEQRGALLVGQALYVGDQPLERVALLQPDDGILARVGDRRGDDLGRDRLRAAQLVDAAVVGDPVQPGAERQLAIARAQTRVRADEDLLDGILGVNRRAGQHLPRVGKHPLAVAIVDGAERFFAAAAEQEHQLLIGAKPEERSPKRESRASQCYRRWECGGFHVNPDSS